MKKPRGLHGSSYSDDAADQCVTVTLVPTDTR